jgi:hypothetical protein
MDRDRLPLPSEDTGDLTREPAEGQTDDYLVAREEGIPYVPPTERVVTEARDGRAGVDVAGTPPTDGGELERDDTIQADRSPPTDDRLLADVIEALRASDVVAGERLRIAADGARIIVRGRVASIDIVDEILGIVGDVPGVDEVVDETTLD